MELSDNIEIKKDSLSGIMVAIDDFKAWVSGLNTDRFKILWRFSGDKNWRTLHLWLAEYEGSWIRVYRYSDLGSISDSKLIAVIRKKAPLDEFNAMLILGIMYAEEIE